MGGIILGGAFILYIMVLHASSSFFPFFLLLFGASELQLRNDDTLFFRPSDGMLATSLNDFDREECVKWKSNYM